VSNVDKTSLITAGDLASWSEAVRGEGKKIVFTNGCFDLLHPGHMALLAGAAALGDLLVVGLNSDDSVRRLKGESRPVYSEADRAEALLAVRWVDKVTVFKQDTPIDAIRKIRPDVLVKGAEYGDGEIVGEEFLEEYGGVTVRFPMKPGHASSEIIKRMESSADADSSE